MLVTEFGVCSSMLAAALRAMNSPENSAVYLIGLDAQPSDPFAQWIGTYTLQLTMALRQEYARPAARRKCLIVLCAETYNDPLHTSRRRWLLGGAARHRSCADHRKRC